VTNCGIQVRAKPTERLWPLTSVRSKSYVLFFLQFVHYIKEDRQALLKAKYCPRVMPVQHFVNSGQLVQAVSCTHTKKNKNLCDLDL